MHEILSIFKSIVISTLFIIALLFLIFRLQDIPRSFPVLLFIVSLLGVTGPRVLQDHERQNIKETTKNSSSSCWG